MKIGFLTILLFITLKSLSNPLSETSGTTLFKTNCTSCHSIGKGRIVGPDLKGVNEKRSEAWLLKWIKSSQSFIKSGDKDAIAINEEFNKVPMTDFSSFTDEQIKSILSYIKEEGNATVVTAVATPATAKTDQVTNNNTGISLSLTNIILLSLGIVMLIVIFVMSKTIKKLADELGDHYDNNRAFFKK